MPLPIPHKENKIPIATILKWYLERRKGKVVKARNEIQRRFHGLDWDVQKEIILAFLSSGKSDREWIYKKVENYWDDAFMDKVKDVFEKYHEKGCYFPVIKYFPTNYIIEHMDELSVNHCYYNLCYRLVYDHVDFNPNWHRLLKQSPIGYLTIMKLAGKKIDDSEANDILYGVIHTIATRFSEFDVLNYDKREKGTPMVPSDFYYVMDLIAELVTMDCEQIVYKFYKWEQELYSTILNSDVFKRLKEEEYVRESDILLMSKKFIYRLLPDKYKSPTDKIIDELEDDYSYLDKMKVINPNLTLLIDKLGLDTTDH